MNLLFSVVVVWCAPLLFRLVPRLHTSDPGSERLRLREPSTLTIENAKFFSDLSPSSSPTETATIFIDRYRELSSATSTPKTRNRRVDPAKFLYDVYFVFDP